MAYWGRIHQSKLKHLSYQWKRCYFQNHYASSFISTASRASPRLLKNPSCVKQNSNRPSDFCNNMRVFGASAQSSSSSLRLLSANGCAGNRRFSVFNEFSEKMKGEANRNPEFQQSLKELKEKAEELKGVKEDLKNRTKQTTEQLYKHVDGVWTEAEATAKKVSANMKEKISAATEEVKETLGVGKQESSEFSGTSANDGSNVKDGSKASSGEENYQQSASGETAETLFSKFKSSLPSQKVSLAFQKLKEAKITDLAKKGYDIVRDELSGTTSKKKHLQHNPSTSTGERSTKTDIVIVPTKQSPWSKKWEAFKEKLHGNPTFKRISGFSEPVVTKSQEIAEDVRERWETSDNPIVHKIQDLNESIFQETDAAISVKEIRQRDPSFSLPEFVAEVQEATRPVLHAYMKADVETLQKYCGPEVIERCKAEYKAYQSNGIFFDNKILHISDVEVKETKMMGNSPIIIFVFQTQQVYCVRDRHGSIIEGGQDTIHTVYYAWAMQLVDAEELGDGALYPIWRLREMQQFGVLALI
ncbi:mitochondrial import inner membrane translocase subunit TIM44-2-like [Corylus avellana]|uniref:mitochondrial import inner membrane translocase subunit TIM44-2-like n=1 Tax=Corylus avellana TaxID=13451 RepID=UPI00286C4CFC|nr:mitochondrial import inner membrane translocase subunit TIM44-2-like [Corylus avellana]